MELLRSILTASACALLASTARAADWYVDDDGGPGVDFTSVADALAVATHNDRVFVAPGTYPEALDDDQGVRILATGPGVVISGAARWHDLPATRELRIVGVAMNRLTLEDCAGAVIVAEVDMATDSSQAGYGGVVVARCADVRLRDCRVATLSPAAVLVDESRVELVGCEVTGAAGVSGSQSTDGGPGGIGVEVLGGGDVTLAASTVVGGGGGDSIDDLFGHVAGRGGNGAYVHVGGGLRVTGSAADAVRGGDGGVGPGFDDDGAGGHGVHVEGALRYSGAVPAGGDGGDWVDGQPIVGAGAVLHATPDDPVLELDGAAHPGATLSMRVRGEFGHVVVLVVGRRPDVFPWPGSPDLALTVPARQISLGVIPQSGVLEHQLPIPAGRPAGTRFVLQARVEGGVEVRTTNSAPVVLY